MSSRRWPSIWGRFTRRSMRLRRGDGDAEEIDEGLLDTLHVASDRFTRLLDLLAGRAR